MTYQTTQTTPSRADADGAVERDADLGSISTNHAGPGAVAQAYARLAPIYDFVFGKALDTGRRALAAAASAHQPASLLEVGVGSGLTLPLYPASTEVVGIDLSEDMLARARARAAAMPGRRIELRRLNAEHMPFADASFEMVTVPYVLSVTPDAARFVREIRRVCKPGGTIVIANHFNDGALWTAVGKVAGPFMRRVGVNREFRFDEQILCYDWDVVSARRVDLFGLSTLVEIRNQPRGARAVDR